MKASTIAELKKELQLLPQKQLVAHCIRMAQFKVMNKELLSYLLFEQNDEQQFVDNVMEEMDAMFKEINSSNSFFLLKKSIRKILRHTHKHIKFSQIKTTEIQLLMHFCQSLKNLNIGFEENKVLLNMYNAQVKKIHKAIETLHPDERLDYNADLDL
ncbi:MAG TPA: hypothetical protein PK736_07530 [Bacteroidia bacterium]|nr:hypothetical protein [Bacteroidia bacterium]